MMTVGKAICDSHDCTRPGCSPDAGCQGHVKRELMPGRIKEAAERLVATAAEWGVLLTIEQRPLLPFAMGHYETIVSVRQAMAVAT